jgi:3-oxoacyl-[acyl-carrier-protein] synthase II
MCNKYRRVAVTGLGAVTALGIGQEETWQQIVAGKTGLKTLTAWKPDRYLSASAGECAHYDPLDHFTAKQARRLDRCHQMELIAAREAVNDAGFGDAINPADIAITIGSSLGGMNAWLKFQNEYSRHNRHRRASYLIDHFLHRCIDILSEEFGFLGPRSIFSTACTASTVGLTHGFEMVRSGDAPAALVGGVDPISEFSFAGFSGMRNVSASPCAPFSDPIGLNTGEGSAFLVLEDWETARARGATIYAEMLGYGISSDGYHPTAPDPVGHSQKRAMNEAFAMAGISPEDVDYVNAHGTGTSTNDATETRLLSSVFGGHVKTMPVSSLKGALGHTLGAAGAVEALFTVKAIATGKLPPTANFQGARAGCTLDYVPQSRDQQIDVALTQNFAFGGNNASLIFGHPDRSDANMVTASAARDEKRVVITGMGPVSPVGSGVDEFLTAIMDTKSGVIDMPDVDPIMPKVGAPIVDFDPAKYARFPKRRMDKFGQLTVCSIMLAAADSGIKITKQNAGRIGIVGGTAYGPMASCKEFNTCLVDDQPAKANPGIFPNTVFNAGVGLASIQMRVRGCNLIVCNGQSSGLDAIMFATRQIKAGNADMIFAGGVDELEIAVGQIYGGLLKTRNDLGMTEDKAPKSAPFSNEASQPIMGEGAAFFAVESLDHALARGAEIYGEILGDHSFADASQTAGWDRSGHSLARGMEKVLARANVSADKVDLLVAGAMSNPLHDRVEENAIQAVFGKGGVPVLPISSTLGVSGATGALGLAAGLLGMKNGFLPAGDVSKYEGSLDLVQGENRKATPEKIMVNACAFGGGNACMLIGKYKAG